MPPPPPPVRVPALAAPPAVLVGAPPAPAVARVAVGSIGPAGASAYDLWRAAGHTGDLAVFLASLRSTVPGPPGPAGLGQITYTERAVTAADRFRAGERKQLRFEPDLTQVADFLNAPFSGHSFWINDRIVPRARGDLLDVTVNLIVTAEQESGRLRVDLDLGSLLGPTGAASATLFNGAGEPERVTFRLVVQVLDNFLANGAALYLTSDVDLTVISESILIHPASTFAGILP